MAQLHQIQIQYDPHQDRGLLRVRSRGGEEYRFWLTRRYVRALWPLLAGALRRDEAVRRQADERAREAVLAFRHEQAVRDSDFETAYQGEGVRCPLGEEPILLARAQVRPGPPDGCTLAMHPARGQGIDLALDGRLLHSLCRLVTELDRSADWGLALAPAPPAAAPEPGARLN